MDIGSMIIDLDDLAWEQPRRFVPEKGDRVAVWDLQGEQPSRVGIYIYEQGREGWHTVRLDDERVVLLVAQNYGLQPPPPEPSRTALAVNRKPLEQSEQ